MSIGNKIKDLRKAHGLTQDELSKALKMNRCILNRIELGTRPVKDDEIKELADFFGVSADFLLNTKFRSNMGLTMNDTATARLVNLIQNATPKGIQLATSILEQMQETAKRRIAIQPGQQNLFIEDFF